MIPTVEPLLMGDLSTLSWTSAFFKHSSLKDYDMVLNGKVRNIISYNSCFRGKNKIDKKSVQKAF